MLQTSVQGKEVLREKRSTMIFNSFQNERRKWPVLLDHALHIHMFSDRRWISLLCLCLQK